MSDRIEDTEVAGVTAWLAPGREAEGVAAATHIAGHGRNAQSRALKNDRKWFARHHWRRYRMRPAMEAEWPDGWGASHTLVMRLSRFQHARIILRLREGETMPNTDREIAAMLGIETVI
jgi:hypothetical protein